MKIFTGRLREYADKKKNLHNARSKWQKVHGRWQKRHLSDAEADWWWQTSLDLQEEVDRLWATAREESIKLGHPFQERDGTMFYPVPQRLGTFERSLNILTERIKAGEVTWPPAP